MALGQSRSISRPEAIPGPHPVDRLWNGARAVPAWGWLAGLVLVSFGFRLLYTRFVQGPWIFVDEVIYAEVARSFAESGSFELRDIPLQGFSILLFRLSYSHIDRDERSLSS